MRIAGSRVRHAEVLALRFNAVFSKMISVPEGRLKRLNTIEIRKGITD